MKYALTSLLMLVALSILSGQAPVTPRPLTVLRLGGDPRSIGMQHGQFLKEEIAAVYGKWRAILEGTFGMPADRFVEEFLASTRFAQAIQNYTPALWEELEGLAEGSGQTFQDVLAFQLVDEYWVRADSLDHTSEKHHCSSVGVSARNGQPAYVAQNMDLDTWMEGYQVVMRIHPADGPEQLVFTCAGLIGLTGMNSAGIGVCVNTLMQLRANTTGLPVAFMIRGILGHRDGDSALAFLQQTPHASGQNYILGIGETVRDFEASSRSVVELPADANGNVFHTNHPVVNQDLKTWYAESDTDKAKAGRKRDNSEIRFASVRDQLKASPDPTAENIKDVLRSKTDPDNPVCRNLTNGKSGFTFGSVIYTTSGKLSMQVTSGPPDESAYQTFHIYLP